MSALTGRNVDTIFDMAAQVHADSLKRITTGQLNKFISLCMQRNHPPMIHGKRLRIYYMAQVGVQPPKFVIFVNFPNLMTETYKKYLYNQFRESYSFLGLPLEIYLKGKKRYEKGEKPLVSLEHGVTDEMPEEDASAFEEDDEDEAYVEEYDLEDPK